MAKFWIGATWLASLVAGIPSPSNLKSDVTILIDNDLQGPGSPTANSGVLFLNSPQTHKNAVAACESLGETLWNPEVGVSAIQPSLDYLAYEGRVNKDAKFWVLGEDDAPQTLSTNAKLSKGKSSEEFPVLCSQSAPFSNETGQDTSERWRVSVHSNNEDLIGFRDRTTFRFLGIRYAPQPKRFAYSTMHVGSGSNAPALEYPPQCYQGGSGSEDCLFLNIWTPYLPTTPSEPRSLKPVMFWIYGGGYTGGTSSDPTFDGANIVSRGDVVLVAINYRLGNFGFLALDDGETNGNYGLADAVLALEWVKKNIKEFGGDPEKITIFGQSAGAGTVRALMASPKARGLFQRAIPLSNLGGLGYGTSYSKYYSIEEEMDVVGKAVLEESRCGDVECLRGLNVSEIGGLANTARYLVVDGEYLTSDELPLDGEPLDINLMMGIAAEDGSPFLRYPQRITPDNETWITSQGLPHPDDDVFPLPDFENKTLATDWVGARLATDAVFRCIDQATAHALLENALLPKIYYYEFDRAYQTPGWPKSSLCEPEGRPDGDPEAGPYMRCHSGELLYVFGNIARQGLPMRDEIDVQFERMVVDIFASFARTGDPNPEEGYLKARGFQGTMEALKMAGRWEPAVKGEEKLRILDWPEIKQKGSMMEGWRDLEQCEWLDLGLDYYL